MNGLLSLAIPSKGRLKEQVETWLADAGFAVRQEGGERGYVARLEGLEGVDVRLMSAGDISRALIAGEVHLGVTGADLLREDGGLPDGPVHAVRGLGFGRADMVVAVPDGWIDVGTMADLADVAARTLAGAGRRLRVATKYQRLTRDFFDANGVEAFRVIESLGATEAAPGAGLADVIVDITTTGATLRANRLKTLADGLIVRSEAQLAAALGAGWTDGLRVTAEAFVRTLEARARARDTRLVDTGREAVWVTAESARARALSGTGAATGAVSIGRTDFLFEAREPRWDALAAALDRR